MKLLKPSWVNHDEKPIFSVDIHPAGKRFATGGQGGDSGRVVVWNLNPVLFEEVEVDNNIPKMLCQMDNHLACVNCVRWSNGGKYLASGGDDRLVMVWGLTVAAGALGKHKAESWRCLATLRGHAGDVLDLAWSPLDKWLASCSVDNTVIIWNAEKFPEMVCVLNGHTGLVKGVAWDPVGKYLASQSDDKSLRVWKTADWTEETRITDPFEECGGTTHVLRLSWSPDGQYVLSAHAMNGGGPTAQVVEREGWRCDKDFVGHRKAVTCARFNSNIFVKDGKKCCCAAVGSRDRALSIWLTSLKRPLVVVHDLFADSVLDLSWSSDGLNLLACSSDGTVACIQFTNKEIGTPLSVDEKNAFYEKIYGKCPLREANDTSLLVECPEILLARERAAPPPPPHPPAADKTSTIKPSVITDRGSSTPLRPVDRQIETRTSDGKRRITPVFIPITMADANESLGSISGAGGPESCFSTSSQSKSRIRVERRDDIIIHPNVSNHATHAPQPTSGPQMDARLRKRSGAALPGPSADEVATKRPRTEGPAPAAAPALSLPVPALGTAGPVVRAAGAYRLQVVNKGVNTQHGSLARLELIPNNSVSNDPVWETYLGSPVSCVACDARWACAACSDGSLHVWRLTRAPAPATPPAPLAAPPSRALPPIALPSPAARLSLCGDTLVAATTGAEVCAWDLAAAAALQPPLSFRNLLTPGANVTSCSLLEDGNAMITLSSGRTYIHCKKLSSWVVWEDAADPVRRAGGAACRALRTPRTPGRTRPPPPPLLPNSRMPAATTSGAARSWLEAQLAASEHLRLAREYRHWHAALFAHLLTHGTEEQVRCMLDDMLGPAHCTSTPLKWQPDVLGIKKHDILEEMLTLLVQKLRWQRLYTEYSDQLNDLKKSTMVNGH
ncbi:protein HIRA homolog [Aricia agestis]|uniref:protein HIRA homolog n=1 Tax=Aricia agestis TaxID=91739 RepID=UPI001C20B45E|nr:protein HIRA homolog [Aricia agestis]